MDPITYRNRLFLCAPPAAAALGALVGNLSFTLVDGEIAASAPFGLLYRFGIPAVLTLLMFSPRGDPWKFGATRAQWAAFAAAFLAPTYSSLVLLTGGLDVPPTEILPGLGMGGSDALAFAILAVVTFGVTFFVHRKEIESTPLPEAFPALRFSAFVGFLSSLVLAGALMVRHSFQEALTGGGFYVVGLTAAMASILFLVGAFFLERAVFRRKDFAHLGAAIGFLAIPLAVSTWRTGWYTLKIATGEIGFYRFIGGFQEDLTIIPAAVAGWVALGSLVAILYLQARDSRRPKNLGASFGQSRY